MPTSIPPSDITQISLPDNAKKYSKTFNTLSSYVELAWLSLFTAIAALMVLFQANNVCMLETSSGRQIVLEVSVVP